MKTERLYELLNIATPLSKWKAKYGLSDEVSEPKAYEIIARSRNKEAREWLFQNMERKVAEAEMLRSAHLPNFDLEEGWILEGMDVYITSKALAKLLETNHKEMIRAIRREKEQLEESLLDEIGRGQSAPSRDSLEFITAIQKTLSGFRDSSYVSEQNKQIPMFILSERAALSVSMRKSAKHRALVSDKFFSLREAILKYLNLGNIVMSDKSTRPLPRRLYLLWTEDPAGNLWTKVGVSTDPEHRLRSLNTGSTTELHLYYQSSIATNITQVEAQLHEDLVKRGVESKGEWFMVDPETVLQMLNQKTLEISYKRDTD